MSAPDTSPPTPAKRRPAEDTAGHATLETGSEAKVRDPLLGPAADAGSFGRHASSFSSRPPPSPRVRVAALAKGRQPTRLDHLVGALLMIAYVVALLSSSSGLGMNRDEGFYVDAAESYAGWWDGVLSGAPDAFDRARIDRAWENNHEHPSLPKSLFAFSWLAQQRWHLFPEDSMAFRFPGMVMSSLALWVLYLFGTRIYGRRAGLFAALAYALVPAVFYHSHLDCFDTPIVSMLVLVTYAYYRSLTKPIWAIWTGIAYGFCLETKHNAWILPLVFLVHFAFVAACERHARKAASDAQRAGPRISLRPYWLLGMLLLGPPLFVAMWPWLWNDTIPRIGEYVGFHVNHIHYNIAYLGYTYFSPPSPTSYAWVTTLFTVPLVTIVLGAVGIGMRARALVPTFALDRLWRDGELEPDTARTDVLVFGSFFTPMFVMMMPSTPIFGGTKHFLMAYAMLALFGGAAFSRMTDRLTDDLSRWLAKLGPSWTMPTRVQRGALAVGLVAALASPLVSTVHSHPFGLSYYTWAAGGVPGAADLGMNRQFWGFTTGSLAPWLNEHVPERGSVWICDTTPTAFHMLQRDHLLRDDIRVAWDLAMADYAIVHHEDHFNIVDFQIWEVYGRVDPVFVLTYDGVPIVSVYENPRRRR
ncbi:MAG: glycosyltransferase family 39 protein [Sandaracinaceae bacterium]|nr:glycosyltransferase family 39 protein [Sandaracinaceae bacterium]